jgi:hypothetical protein
MPHLPTKPAAPAVAYTAFLGHRRIANGGLPEVARSVAWHARRTPDAPVLVFNDSTGAQADVDPRAAAHVAARAAQVAAPLVDDAPDAAPASPPRAPGRPRLGVVAREVTLLPRHWEWLALQPGGASVALRRLVDEARKARGTQDACRAAQERTYRFLTAIAGNLPDYEEALRALFAGNRDGFGAAMAPWPDDIRQYALGLATAAFAR